MRLDSPIIYPLVLLSALFASPAHAQSQDTMGVANRLMVRSGLSVQLRGFAKQLETQFEQNRGKFPDALIAELSSAAKEAYRADVLQQDVVEGVAKKMKVEEMNGAITWLETPVGKRVTLAEELASATMDDATLGKYVESLKTRKLPAGRLKLIREIISATYAEDTMVRHFEAMALGVAVGMDSTQPVQKRLGMARLQQQLKTAMPAEQIKQEMRQMLPGAYAYTYRDVGDADLASYIAFMRNSTGKRYHEKTTEAVMEAFTRASVRLGQLVDSNSSRRPA